MKWGLSTARCLLHLPPAKYIVCFHLAEMEKGWGEVAALSRYSGQGFSGACSLRSSYANSDRIWAWVRRLIRPCTLSQLLAVVPATAQVLIYTFLKLGLPAVPSGSYNAHTDMRLHIRFSADILLPERGQERYTWICLFLCHSCSQVSSFGCQSFISLASGRPRCSYQLTSVRTSAAVNGN